ncbi:MAG: DUF4179 domain-containing protein [Clostridia bacterium]|nr:DUF4179 domain-containing protein [Clostridia bacterium]
MKTYDWENAFPAVPAMVHLRLEKALEEKGTMNGKYVRRPAAALALVMALLLALMGVAYAAVNSGILDYLVGGEERASQALKASIQPVTATAEKDHIRIDLTGAIFDGDRLALSFTMENHKPEEMAYVTLDEVLLNGEWIPISFQSFAGQWLPDVFAIDFPDYSRNPNSGGMLSDWLKKEYTGIIQGEATFVVQRPMKQAVVIDPWMWYDYDVVLEDEESRAHYQARKDAILQSGLEVADVFRDAHSYLGEGYTVLDAWGNFLLDQSEYQYLRPFFMSENYGSRPVYHETINREGQMMETARITIPFTLNADSVQDIRLDVVIPDIELENCTAHFEKISVTPLSTLVKLKLYPRENTPEAVAELSRCYGCPSISVPEGQRIEWLQMEGEGFAGGRRDEDGRHYYEISFSWGGMMELPDSLCFSYEFDAEPEEAQIARLRQEFIEKLTIPLN